MYTVEVLKCLTGSVVGQHLIQDDLRKSSGNICEKGGGGSNPSRRISQEG